MKITAKTLCDLIRRGREFPLNYKTVPRIKCVNGVSMSVQAGEGIYSDPRISGERDYCAVEVGFPSVEIPAFTPYCEDPEQPLETVYGYVPTDVVVAVINNFGGIVTD